MEMLSKSVQIFLLLVSRLKFEFAVKENEYNKENNLPPAESFILCESKFFSESIKLVTADRPLLKNTGRLIPSGKVV